MKKITNLLVVASLAMAGAVMAQEPTPEASQAPGKNKGPKKEQTTTHAPKSDAPATNVPANEPPPPPKIDKKTRKVPPATAPELKTSGDQPAMTPATTPTKMDRKSNKKVTPATTTDATAEKTETAPVTSATPDMTKNSRRNKNSKANATPSPNAPDTAAPTTTPKVNAKSSPAAMTTPAPTVATTPAPTAAATMTPAAGATINPVTTPGVSPAPSVSQTTTTNVAKTKKPDPAKIQQIKQQHTSFRAQANPQRVPPVTFSAGFRLPGVEMWTGPQYEVYRSYHPERHDRGWYHQHYQRVELIAGGYYYFNNGYWYPAWGYDNGHEYYAYDAPIYVGHRSEPPDRVIADVQAALQEMGYYKGEVDGLLGPLTREALTGYQTDNGMTVTAVIDEPTLDSLGMG